MARLQANSSMAKAKGVAFQIDRWNFELTLIADDPKSHLFRPFSWLMNSFELERIRLTSLEVGRCHTASSDVRCSTSRLGCGGMAQTITTGGDEERLREGVERLWGPLPLERTAEFGAHAPVCSFVVRPVLDVDLLEAVNRDVIGDAAPAHDDTAETLRQRLAHSTAFDNPRIVCSKRGRHGHFKYQSDIEVKEGGQPRRATFAEPVGPVVLDESGSTIVRMRGYMHLYRHHDDCRMCRPMPASLRTLRDVLYTQVRI